MSQRFDLMGAEDVASATLESISLATQEFSRRHPSVRLQSWYHDLPLWYLTETRTRGGIRRRIQLALVALEGGATLEVTGDFEIRQRGHVLLPSVVKGRLLHRVGIDVLETVSLKAILEETWSKLADRDVRGRDASRLVELNVFSPVVRTSKQELEAEELAARLTVREVDVLRLLAEGSSSDEIAKRLEVSPNTVRTHVQSILSKLQVHSRLEAAAFALRSGLVKPGYERRARTLRVERPRAKDA